MKKVMSVSLIVSLLLLGLMFAYWLSWAVPANPERSKNTVVKGTVASVERDADTKDIIVQLMTDEARKTYYINRGMEREPDSKALDSLILNRQVAIAYYNGGWCLFGENKSSHICEIVKDNQVIYTEFSR